MATVLIPSNDPCFLVGWAEGYRACGYDVAVGSLNLFLGNARCDLVHFMWPEEFCYRRSPDDATLERISNRLNWWCSRVPAIITVNNFYPHGFDGDPGYRRLYQLFYDRCIGLHHFSSISRELVNREWPVTASKPSIVTLGFSYAHLVRQNVNRDALRRALGCRDDEFIILVFGALRTWKEIQLLMHAFRRVSIPLKRFLLVCRCTESRTTLVARLRYRYWSLWQRFCRAVSVSDFVADEELYRYFEAADVVVVPRVDNLSSGVPGLAMTFGRMVIAPNHGAFPEYLAGTDNLLYESGSPVSLARAIEQAVQTDRVAVGQRNHRIAETWGWQRTAQECLRMAGAEKFGNAEPVESVITGSV